MYVLKLLFHKLQIRPVLAPGRTADLLGTAKDYRLGTTGGIRAFVFQGETETTCPGEQLTVQDMNVAASFT